MGQRHGLWRHRNVKKRRVFGRRRVVCRWGWCQTGGLLGEESVVQLCRGCGRDGRGEGRDVVEGERCGRRDWRNEGRRRERGEEERREALWGNRRGGGRGVMGA